MRQFEIAGWVIRRENLRELNPNFSAENFIHEVNKNNEHMCLCCGTKTLPDQNLVCSLCYGDILDKYFQFV